MKNNKTGTVKMPKFWPKDTMLLPVRGIQTVYFVVEDKGYAVDVVACNDQTNKFDLYEEVNKSYFKLHEKWDYYIKKKKESEKNKTFNMPEKV